MKKLCAIFLALALALVATACNTNSTSGKGDSSATAQETLTIKHQLGETKVKKNPQKVVVFDFGVLDSLDKLGIEVAGAPKSSLPSYLAKFKDAKVENVGGLKEPDFEKINAIAPDLIVISARQAESYKEFSEIAPTIYLGVDSTRYMDSFKENMNTLGKIFGKEAVVKQELANIDRAIENLNKKATASDKKALIVLANEGKVSSYGPGSRFGLIHDVFGVKPVDSNIKASTHGQSISFEYIVDKNPDYLFVIDRGAVVGGQSGAKQVIENELVKKTTAFKEGHIVYLDPNYWYLSGGGLASVAEMVREIEQGLK
jgi:iron complex transport system substrate-binding protein